jgi:hypothetical protein
MSGTQEDALNWISVRLAVGAALIIGSAVFYAAYWLTMFRTEDKKAYIYMNEIASKYYLYGLGALLSLNYAQAGIFQAIMIYLTMVTFIGLIITAVLSEKVDDQKRNLAYVVFYFFLFVWYLGIMIDFFVTFS